MLLLLLKSVEYDDDVALLLSVAGLVMGTHVFGGAGVQPELFQLSQRAQCVVFSATIGCRGCFADCGCEMPQRP